MGLIKDDELIATEVDLCVGDREECTCPRKDVHSACCWGGPDSLEGGGVCVEFRQGRSAVRLFPQTLHLQKFLPSFPNTNYIFG